MTRKPEEQLQKAVVEWLNMRAPGLLWWATPNEGVRGGIKNAKGQYFSPDGQKRKAMGVLSGVADLLFLVDGRPWFIELKVDGYQTANQRGFEALVKEQGCKYEVCRSLDEVAETLVAWGLLPERVLGELV